MVEIREESPTPGEHGTPEASAPPSTGTHSHSVPTHPNLTDFLKTRQTDAFLFLTRLVTVFFALSYIFPLGTRSSQLSAYSRAFASAAATNALRVHQRVGGLRFTREFLSMLLMEDSCHYLIYSVLFITATPVTMALMPIFLYALLHATNFAVQMCHATGKATNIANKVSELTRQHTQNLLGVIACSEIFLMPMLVAMVFAMVFYQLRISLEQAVSNPSCPQIIRNAILSLVNVICRLCPATV